MNLNKQQQEAVEFYGHPQVIIAGRYGKTTVMIQKINYLIKKNMSPIGSRLNIYNKAANEMRERFEIFNRSSQRPLFGTFHSFCLRF